MQGLLDALGNPERALPPVIHVAGTNGKGSTCAYTRAILEAAGHRVHAYTSPHLVRFNERIVLAGREIDDPSFAEILEECEAVNADAPITLFEITTAAALLAFARTPADALVLEVGLGGRFDATNVVGRPAAAAIAPVSIDHQQYLGDTLELIAFEKAGILKPGVPGVIGIQDPRALAVIEARAAEVGAPLTRWGREFSARLEGERLVFEMDGVRETLPRPALPGAHQIGNAALALAVCRTVAAELANAPVDRARGLLSATWPARLQRLTRGPLLARVRPDWSLWLDGGHNEDAGRAIGEHVAGWRRADPEAPVHLILGMLNTKDPRGYLRHFAGLVDSVATVTIPGEQASLSAEDAAAAARDAGVPATTAASVAEAVARAGADPRPGGRVLIAGSLYLAGKVLADHG
ncbi:bifunctional folylpolyglutamate synthase/dihydrofolate synthase [Thalassobaculum fulvum]|uniref:Dihydrofolate synthase/folylpolyglutamate synthase n=1 Tax=Thalassobaculum fulvum TaxID=1633335 RepID=A0A918XP35_9PROT|nr:folylpolyglutamate synthase/dihydrofolate synthase family protein [Thalassobaculum fulvum]GHD40578.1 bifunctional folylpolyglutamate synthase/dihydrofolate synthase [Thalassobaculum fulvum]